MDTYLFSMDFILFLPKDNEAVGKHLDLWIFLVILLEWIPFCSFVWFVSVSYRNKKQFDSHELSFYVYTSYNFASDMLILWIGDFSCWICVQNKSSFLRAAWYHDGQSFHINSQNFICDCRRRKKQMAQIPLLLFFLLWFHSNLLLLLFKYYAIILRAIEQFYVIRSRKIKWLNRKMSACNQTLALKMFYCLWEIYRLLFSVMFGSSLLVFEFMFVRCAVSYMLENRCIFSSTLSQLVCLYVHIWRTHNVYGLQWKFIGTDNASL